MTMIELSRRLFLRHIGSAMAAAFALIAHVSPVAAQGVPQDWTTMPGAPDVTVTVPFEPAEPETSPQRKNGSTSIPRSPSKDKDGGAGAAVVHLVAMLTVDGQRIDKGVVWRVFEDKTDADGRAKLLSTHREGSPDVKLKPGDYMINAAYGRANLTRRVSVKDSSPLTEQFVLNAGGLRVTALLGKDPAQANTVTYDIYSDDRDQFSNRSAIMTDAKPGVVVRLNAGIYQIVSTYGDANASIRADVTVEAGKLTEATVSHAAGRVSFKLVTREGGEAIPDTQWRIQTPDGQLVKQSVGALPMHFLAPGNYTVLARSDGETYQRDFKVASGDALQLEVLMQKGADTTSAAAP
jgi:hypothetical protein